MKNGKIRMEKEQNGKCMGTRQLRKLGVEVEFPMQKMLTSELKNRKISIYPARTYR